MKRFFTRFAIVLAIFVLLATPLSVALARSPIDSSPPVFTIDWKTILDNILTAVLPALATALTAFALASTRYWWSKLEHERPDIVDLIQQAATFAVPAIRQLQKNGTIPDNQTAFNRAVDLVRDYLMTKGVTGDQFSLNYTLVVHAIENAVHYVNQGAGTTTIEMSALPPAQE